MAAQDEGVIFRVLEEGRLKSHSVTTKAVDMAWVENAANSVDD